MKLGVMTVCLSSLSLDEACRYLKEQGVQQVEIGCGGSPGTAHCDARKMAGDPAAADEFAATVAKHGLTISAFAVHGNPLHPDQETAGTAHAEFEAAVLLAERLGVKTVITFSGCPGDCETRSIPTGRWLHGRKTTKRSAAGSGRKN
ncbi:MAG: sugar phosphate isomerase/epimerase family protein [Ruthenibacterium lactatiformans]